MTFNLLIPFQNSPGTSPDENAGALSENCLDKTSQDRIARGLFNDKSWSRPGRHLHGPDPAPLGRKTKQGRVMAGSSVARVPPGAETGTSQAPGRLLGSAVPQEPLLPAPRPWLCDPPVRSPGSSPILPRCPAPLPHRGLTRTRGASSPVCGGLRQAPPCPLPSGSRDRRAASQKSLKWPGDLPNRARERRHIPPTVLGAAARPGTMTAEARDSAALPEEGLPAEVTPCPFVGHRGKRVPYAAQSHVGRQDGRLQDPAQTGRGTQTPGGRARRAGPAPTSPRLRLSLPFAALPLAPASEPCGSL